MKKIALAGFVVFTFIVYSLYQRRESRAAVVPPPSISQPSNTPSTPTGAVSGGSTPAPAGQYKNGQYIGSVEDAYYGNVQVKATISGGKLAKVDFLQYPSDRSTSREINSQAIPYLQQEAVQVQSAQVDIVSGATYTSDAFTQSLSSALSQAKS
jgi:uncharacterized protein with FMN-binding domain